MLTKLRRHLTYANVVSTLCLFILLGGTAFAATRLARNSVRSKHIKNGQVTRPDLRASAVNSSKVGDGSLLARDFAPGQLPQGAKGDKGDKGDTGDNGTADAFARVTAAGTLLPKDPPDNPDFGNTSFNITQENVDRPGAPSPGVYCIRGLPFKLSSAMVAPDNVGASAAADNDVIVSVAVERGNNINPCDDVAGRPKAQARVVATEADGSPANLDHGFVIWLEGEQ